MRTLKLVALLAASAVIPAAFAAPQKAKSRKIIDREAGVAYTVTLPHGEVVQGENLDGRLAKVQGLWLPPHSKATSALFVPGSTTPYLVVSKRNVEGGISRELVDALKFAPERASETSGLARFVFYPDRLQGVADAQPGAGPQAKVLLQLVKDRATCVTYYYQKPEQLTGFESLHKSLYVGKKSKLALLDLPRHPSSGPGIGGILTMLAALTAVGFGAFLVYRRASDGPQGSEELLYSKSGPEIDQIVIPSTSHPS